jgi:hypothetical protein
MNALQSALLTALIHGQSEAYPYDPAPEVHGFNFMPGIAE